jgi:hypothetical protein
VIAVTITHHARTLRATSLCAPHRPISITSAPASALINALAKAQDFPTHIAVKAHEKDTKTPINFGRRYA